MKSIITVLLGTLLVFASGRALADVMIRPIYTWGGNNPAALCDQMGYVSGVTDVSSFITANPSGGQVDQGFSGTWGGGTPRFDLGSPNLLTGMLLWEANDYYGSAILDVRLETSLDNSQWNDLGYFWFDPGNSSVQWAQFSQPVEARYVTWSWYDNDGNGYGTDIAEVAFSAVPEPTPSAMLALSSVLLLFVQKGMSSRLTMRCTQQPLRLQFCRW